MVHPDDQARWRPWLLPAERLLWAGRPKRGLAFSRADLAGVPLLILWLGMVALDNADLLRDGGPFNFDFPTVMLAVLGALLVGRFFLDIFLRGRLFYALTDRRVLILNAASGRLNSIDIEYLPMLDLEEDRGGRGTLVFASGDGEHGWFDNLSPVLRAGARFYRIEDARRVYDLAQREATRIRRETRGNLPPHRAFLG